jgi:hypothetical protein
MKKIVLLLAVALGGVVYYRKQQAAKAEADLWHEATTAPDLR